MIAYLLIDFQRLNIGVRELVRRIENAIIALLASKGLDAVGDVAAPGVYVNGEKIASLGLRIRNRCTYHGLSLNVAMDLRPFSLINPCGYSGLKVTQLKDLGVVMDVATAADELVPHLLAALEITE